MKSLDYQCLTKFIEPKMVDFHRNRAQSLLTLKLRDVIKRKNPYLFRTKNFLNANDLVKSILDAYQSSKEETIFGGFLEELAIFTNHNVYGGIKSSTEGIDLEFVKDQIRYLVTIKSGPNWGNSSQIARMRDNFKKAKRILRTNTTAENVVAVNGCCYGYDSQPDKGDYLKLCGQVFWEFISGDRNFYIDLIEPLGHEAKMRNEEYEEEFAKVINKFVYEFTTDFCTKEGSIDWPALVSYNSSER